MKTKFSPPYRAHKSAGQWYVVNAKGGFEIACECRYQAEEFASDLNAHANPTESRLSAMMSQLDRGPVNTAPFDPPSDEISIFPQES
jgi:hypothetical protein